MAPQLRSTNWARTRAFYEDGLGLRVQWKHQFEPRFPVFAEVARDSLSLLNSPSPFLDLSAMSISRRAACLIDLFLELSRNSLDGDLFVRHTDQLHT